MVFLPLHPSVLEPNLDLPLSETQLCGDVDASSSVQVSVTSEGGQSTLTFT